MISEEMFFEVNKLKVNADKPIKLKDFETEYTGGEVDKKEGEELLARGRKQLADIQDKLYAHNRFSLLIILQAMDAAGKDGAVKHILSGVNPIGVKIHSFKAPSSLELDHDYLWRHNLALPRRGEIAIHNRSHYENVLVTRIHPELILKENIPGIDSVDKITDAFWQGRFKQINRFEKNVAHNGTIVLKFFLHLSKKEQKKRLLQRIDDPSKNWKFESSDVRERGFWDDYQKAYEEAINATSKKYAPWFVIPADNKWYTRLAIASVIHQELKAIDIHYPKLNESQLKGLEDARVQLMNE